MSEIERLQDYLRASAGQRYETVMIPPFALFFDPADDAIYFNYAIPAGAVEEDIAGPLAELRATFVERGRRPRFEFVEEYAPGLPSILQTNGFVEDGRLHLMICTPELAIAAGQVPGLEITDLDPASPVADLRDYAFTVAQGFNPTHAAPPSDADIERTRQDQRTMRSFLGRIDGEPAGTATYTQPLDGVTEVVGIATREPFRRRGVAAALTAHALRVAFGAGVTLACLTAGDARAGRVYERVGFRPYATMLFYLDPLSPA